MSKSDWDITGDGGIGIVEVGGSKRCRLTYRKLMLWNGNSGLTDHEVIVEIQMGSSTNTRGGIVLRSNESGTTAYRLRMYGPRTYYIQKVVDGAVTVLAIVGSSRAWNEFVKTRFKVDGFQLSVEEWDEGEWKLIASVEDTSQAVISGAAGLYGESVNSDYYVTFDNVEIKEKEVI